MTQEIREFAVTVPAGTAKAAPLVTSIAFPERVVVAVSWRVPPGPSGLFGWALTSAGTPVIPIQQGSYIVTDNQSDTWWLDGYLDSGNWAVTAYNTGIYPHTVYLTFQLDLVGSVGSSSPPANSGGLGVVGASGTVVVPEVPQPPSSSVPAPPAADTAAVIAAVLAAARMQLAPGVPLSGASATIGAEHGSWRAGDV